MPKRKFDWNRLKLEYMTSDISLNALLEKYKIASGRNFQKQTKGWIEERKKLHQEITDRVKAQLVEAKSEQWKDQINLWKAVQGEAARILKQHIEAEKPLEPRELASLTVAIEKALKGQMLIIGEPTERIEERSLHLQLIQINKRIEKGDDLKEIPFKIREGPDSIQNQGQEEKSS